MIRVLAALFWALASACVGFAADKEAFFQIGVAKVDITPTYPIRLSGYAARKTEATNAIHKLWAKALAIGSDKEGPVILITVDNTGVPKHVRDEVVARLVKKKIDPSRISVCSTHSHTAPYLAGYLPTLFGEPLPPEHQAHVERYTRELADAIERVALEALKNRKPGKLSWAQGKAGFAANRRTKDGPVDHDLPMLAISDAKGKLRAIFLNYACHCTTLGPELNQVCGDWATYAPDFLENEHPGVTVMVAIGCGADANPQPRTTGGTNWSASLAFAKQHGAEIATNINQLLTHKLTPVQGRLICRAEQIGIPLDTLPTRAEFEERAKKNDFPGFHARYNLGKLERDGALPDKIPYLVQTWNFGDDLAMVFLPGEVVVDYSLRLKREFDPARLWINAYANDVPCYIPSERILNEGGYEGGGAMTYYGWPARIKPGVENLIVETVHKLMPKDFLFDQKKAEFPPPKSPNESLAAFETKPEFEIQLVASEPLVVDPVAIDWGADGKLWVVEMRDYPTGMDGNWKPGSRVKFLEDTNGDGKYDKATVVIDNIPFATGVTAWRNGALVCTAPDILYVESNSSAPVKKIFSGFVTENYQARVNSLSLGLDNWIYGANGLLGGTIHGFSSGAGVPPATVPAGVPPAEKKRSSFPPAGTAGGTMAGGTPAPLQEVDIRGRDFRMKPDTGAFEPVSGLTQQGRARDDWGNWFGCDNSTLTWHYPIPDHYIRRNPHVAAPSPRVSIASGTDPGKVFPISRTLERFNNPQSANRITSICGLGVYRDVLLGEQLNENIFVCEPVHNLVRRVVPKPNGLTFSGERAPDEQNSEFLASRDSWSRPAQARTGPDGALYVVDMYRFVIEHPRWIAAERLAKLDVRAGDDKGRIYRIVPKDKKLRPVQNLRKLSTSKLVAALDTPNGTVRDLVHLELTQRGDKAAIRPLEELVGKAKLPAVRLQALCVLDGLNAVAPGLLTECLSDENAAVRANAIRLSEPFLRERSAAVSSSTSRRAAADASHTAALLRLTADSELTVRYQLALSLGEWNDPRAAEALGKLAARDMSDAWMRAAIISSAIHHSTGVLQAVLAADANTPGHSEMISQLIATTAGEGNARDIQQITALVCPGEHNRENWQLPALHSLLDALDRKNISLADLPDAARMLTPLFAWSGEVAGSGLKDSEREPAIRLLGRNPERQADDLQLLVELVDRTGSPRVQTAVFDALKRVRSPQVPALLLRDWSRRAPSPRQSRIELMLSRDEWAKALLKAIAEKIIVPTEISLESRQRLLTHRNQEIRQQAAELFKAGGSRKDILAKYQSVTMMSGDAAHGSDVFAKNCSICHQLRGQGHNVGPNLAALADKTPADWLLAIVDPNAVVEPRYVAYEIETKDDRSLNGIVSAETATTLTLIQAGGAQETILRSDLASMRASGLSLMPEGLEQAMSPQDVADLIAYVKSSSPALFGSATPEKAAAARKTFLEGGANGVAKVLSAAEQLPYPSWMGALPLAHCRQTDGHSKLSWQTAPVPADLKPGNVFKFRLPVALGYSSNPAGTFTLRLNGQAVFDFDVTLADKTWQSADGKVRASYTVMEMNEEDSDGVLLIEVAAALLEAGKPATFEVTGSAANSMRWFGIYLVSNRQLTAAGLPQNSTLIEQVLSDATPAKEREAIINAHRELSANFLQELTVDLKPGTPEEYQRIPWIWRVAVGAGKRNDGEEALKILELSLPQQDEPLRDWQAVVIGGGIINGISQIGVWPRDRIEEILSGKADLLLRWHRAIDLASAMADDEKVKPGTRYDALRMVAMDSWDKCGAQLVKYLAQGMNAELQQGAISGLSDMKSLQVAPALTSGLGHYSKSNREFALDALLRDEARIGALLDEWAAGRVTKSELNEKRLEKLGTVGDAKLRARVKQLVAK